MIIYCALPIKGDEKFRNFYEELINHLINLGHTPLCELNSKFKSSIPLSPAQIFRRNIKWIESSELFIAELSSPSVGVGFEISYALFRRRKNVLALSFKETDYVSTIINGCTSELLTRQTYSSSDELKKFVTKFIANFTEEN